MVESVKKTASILLDMKIGGKFCEFFNKMKIKTDELSTENLLIKHLTKKTASYVVADHKKLTEKSITFWTENIEKAKEIILIILKADSEGVEFLEKFKAAPNIFVKVLSKSINVSDFEKALLDAEIEKASNTTSCTTNSNGEVECCEETRYKFIQLLGSGAEGVVNLFKDTKENMFVAIKTCSMKDLTELVKAQIREKEQMAIDIKSPTMIEFYKTIENESERSIYIEFAKGGTLNDYLRSIKLTGEQLSSDQILNWFVQILIALKTLHNKNLSHRDIKPENILLCENPKVNNEDKKSMIAKISDLGISKVIEGTAKHTVIGTPHYVAPEVISDYEYNKTVDLWSLAVMMYEISLRVRPFDDLDTYILQNKIKKLNIQNTLPNTLDYRIRYILEKLLKKNPESRISMNHIFSLDFIREKVEGLLEIFPEWREKYKELFDEILSYEVITCPYNPNILHNSNYKIVENCMKIMENVDAKTYKKGFLGGKIDNAYLGLDIEVYLQDNFSGDEEIAIIDELINKKFLINISSTNKEEFDSNDYYTFSFDFHGQNNDNPAFGNIDDNREAKNLLKLSEQILNLGIQLEKIVIDDDRVIELSSSNYINFIYGISLFRKFNLLEKSTFKNKEEKLAFLLNLYQIMFLNNLIKEKMAFKKKKGLLDSLIKNDVSINYIFKDCSINNLELRHGVFRDNQKPLENYMRICSGNDSRLQLSNGLTIGVMELLVVCDFIPLQNYSSDCYVFFPFNEVNFSEQKFQYMIDFSNICMEFDDTEIRVPPQYAKYFELDLKGGAGLMTALNKAYQHTLNVEYVIQRLERAEKTLIKKFENGSKLVNKVKAGSIKIIFE